jgi:UDP-N-acetylmuramoyl-tripeptide--D-alanyl-D-alanine ligase
MKSSLAELGQWMADALVSGEAGFNGVSTDSRGVMPGNLFIALRGEHFDAHDFLDEVITRGAAAVVVEQLPNAAVPALIVADTRVALGEIARFWRGHFTMPVIGVTGSNGKTTVKEMIAAILEAAFGAESIATRGNLNNDIGVPLTILRLHDACRAAVVELGMNHPGEIAVLASIARPTVALVNNAQREHQEFMASVAAVAAENGAVLSALDDDGIAVFPADEEFTPLWRSLSGQRKTITFGFSDDADVRCSHVPNAFGSELDVSAGTEKFTISLAAAGVHNVRNALAAIACTLAIGIDSAAIRRGLQAFSPVSGRLQRKTARVGACVIDDTYNANPDSVRAAIDVLQQASTPRVLVLGDMGEVGTDGPAYHREIGAYAHASGIEHLFTLGVLAADASAAFGDSARHFDDMQALLQVLDDMLTPQATVLVKGSRFMKMERVVRHLMQEPAQEHSQHNSQEIH